MLRHAAIAIMLCAGIVPIHPAAAIVTVSAPGAAGLQVPPPSPRAAVPATTPPPAAATTGDAAPLPEPSGWALLLIGFGSVGLMARWRQRRPVVAA